MPSASPSPKRKAGISIPSKSPKKLKAEGERNIGDAMSAELLRKLRLYKSKPVPAVEISSESKEAAPTSKPKLRVDTALAAAIPKKTPHYNPAFQPGVQKQPVHKTQTAQTGVPEAWADGMELDEPLQNHRPERLTADVLQRRRAAFFASPDYDATLPAPNIDDEHIEFLFGRPGQNERSPSFPLGSEGHRGDETMREDTYMQATGSENDEMFPGAEHSAATPPPFHPLSPSWTAAPITGDGTSDFKSQTLSSNRPIVSNGQEMVDEKSGYTWTDEEDAPGYAWKNKKAQEEAARAWNNVVDKDQMIGRRFGDIGSDEDRKNWKT